MFQPANYDSSVFPEPRAFQAETHERLREGYAAGHKAQMVMAPTGSGKTYIGLRIIHQALQRGRKAIFLCDRTTLINQTSAVADRYGLGAHGVLQAKHWRMDPDSPFQIASAMTIARRSWPDCDVLVIDEAHTQLKVWIDYVADCKASVIGLSATPFSPGLGKIFTNLVNATTMHELTNQGVLVPLRVFSCTPTDMRGAATAGGEWTEEAAAERGMAIVGNVVAEWSQYAENRKTIVFGSTIAHCEELCRQYNEAGIPAAVFCADTTPEERKVLLEEFSKQDGSLRVLISVEALAKGFDVPDVSCVVDCRPLRKSLSTAIQMWGRGLRASIDTGKTDCILLDHSGNFVRFIEDYTQIFFSGLDALDAGEKLDKVIRKDDDEEKEVKACPKCGFKPFARRCISCGHEHQSMALVEHGQGEMREVMIGKNRAVDRISVWEQVVTYARAHGKSETQKGRAMHLYEFIVGAPPKGMPMFDATRNVPISHDVMNKIKRKAIAFAKTKARRAA